MTPNLIDVIVLTASWSTQQYRCRRVSEAIDIIESELEGNGYPTFEGCAFMLVRKRMSPKAYIELPEFQGFDD